MLRRPHRTEDPLQAGGEDGAYLCGSLEGGGELKQWPRAQPSGSRLQLKREHGAYRFFCSRSTARELAAARGVRRSNARGGHALLTQQESGEYCFVHGHHRWH